VKRVRCLVSGRVQGVFFRGAMQARMRELGVRGWVRNLADGRVEALVCGDDAQVDLALAFLRRGPRGAQVDEVAMEDAPAAPASPDFEIRR
jgi:acylphosphatase